MSLSTSGKHKCLMVTHDTINFSKTQQKYSFSRDQRFKSIAGTVATPSEFTHTLQTTFGRRSPSFGVGDRFKQKWAKDSPEPATYQINSDFDSKTRATLPKTEIYSFGRSATREQQNKVYNPLCNSPREVDSKAMPGPGNYEFKNMTIGTEARRFSFLRRTRNSMEPQNLSAKSNVPGPGSYEPATALSNVGKYPISTLPNSRAANWSPSKIRFYDANRHTKYLPGPGAYDPSDIESNSNSYIVSNFRNTGNVKFIKPKTRGSMRSKTPLNAKMLTPGPGSYILPSDFGYLEAKSSPRNFVSTRGSIRPRNVSRLQLSTLTGQIDHNLGEFSVTDTARDMQQPMTAQSVKKRQNHSMFKRLRTGASNDLGEDSILAFNDRLNDISLKR